jgi:hypothetical protein
MSYREKENEKEKDTESISDKKYNKDLREILS